MEVGIDIEQQIIYGKNHFNVNEKSFSNNQLSPYEIINLAYLNSKSMEKQK